MTTAPRHDTLLRVLGRRLRVAQWSADGGERGEPALLILNGIGMNLELIEPLARALAPRRVVAFDMPGVGKSPDPLVPYNAVTMAMTASVLLDRLGLDRVDVMGISWGGGIAQQLALQHRSRVARLVLAASSAGMIMVPGSAATLARFADPSNFRAGRAFHRTLAMLTNGGGGGAPVSLNAATPPSPTGWLYQLVALLGWSSVPFLPWLDVPTLIVAGAEDHVVPPLNARLLHALIPNSRLRLIDGGGHLFVLSHAAELVGELETFLARDAAVESA
jgi:pimeloyl-ACP methyl ester carboxylesterase